MEDINKALLYIKKKHNGEIPYQYGSKECAALMVSYAKEYHQQMKLHKELLDFLEANNWLSLENEENAKGVVAVYLKVYKPNLHKEKFDKKPPTKEMSWRTWEFSFDEEFDSIEMKLEVPNNKDPYDILLEHVPKDIADKLWYRCV